MAATTRTPDGTLEVLWGKDRFTDEQIKTASVMRGDAVNEQDVASGKKKTKDRQKKKKTKSKIPRLYPWVTGKGHRQTHDAEDEKHWATLLTYIENFTEAAEELKELQYEQAVADSFEAWHEATPDDEFQFGDGAGEQMDPFLPKLDGLPKNMSYSQLESKVIVKILDNLDLDALFIVSVVCPKWKTIIEESGLFNKWYDYHYDQLFGDNEKELIPLWTDIGDPTKYSYELEDGWAGKISLNLLVTQMTPHVKIPDEMDIDAFIMRYKVFTTTQKVFLKLLERFDVPIPDTMSGDEKHQYIVKYVTPIQVRVAGIMRRLLCDETAVKNFEKEVFGFLKVGFYLKRHKAVKSVSSIIHTVIDRAAKLFFETQLGVTNVEEEKDETNTNLKIASIADKTATPLIVAEQLTIIEFGLYKHLHNTEFFGQSWTKKKNYHKAPNIRKMIDRFNLVTKWIVWEIVSVKKLRMRVKMVIKFIEIGFALMKLNNFHTLMALTAALQDTALGRLKFTWAAVYSNPGIKEKHDKLKALMAADAAYTVYRNHIKKISPPAIPYIGIYLRDLVLIEEAVEERDKQFIYYNKQRRIFYTIRDALNFQLSEFPIQKVEKVYNYLKNLQRFEDPDMARTLYNLSLAQEPRSVKNVKELVQ